MEIRKEYLKELNNRLYRLEFHQEKQLWHYEKYDSKIKENTHGWVTICDKVTDQEAKILIWYVDSFKEKNMTIEFLLNKRNEFITFYTLLINNDWNIVPVNYK